MLSNTCCTDARTVAAGQRCRRRAAVEGGTARARSNRWARCDIIELQRRGNGMKNTVRGARQVPPLQPHVIVGADPGQDRDLLTAQTWHPPFASEHRQSGLFRRDLSTSSNQEVADLFVGAHTRPPQTSVAHPGVDSRGDQRGLDPTPAQHQPGRPGQGPSAQVLNHERTGEPWRVSQCRLRTWSAQQPGSTDRTAAHQRHQHPGLPLVRSLTAASCYTRSSSNLNTERGFFMRGVVMHAPGDVRVEDIDDPGSSSRPMRSSGWPRPASAGPTCGPTGEWRSWTAPPDGA